MMNTRSSIPAILSLSFLLFFFSPARVLVEACQTEAQLVKTWCVAKPSTNEVDLQNNINFVCSMTDCSLIQKNGSCFFPESTISHASVAMNLYFQSRGRNSWNCNFRGSGLIVTTDPSYDACKYAYD